ncbi:hypothetical protein EIN_060080 [Entamoeba invadens IP1]|uniref:hypothetical protein n=1 Tax=Entamoeba invadens IP1 TaxID=370355 RepID=UPI0002C3CFCE|nr:hypothetical protein EIN_060080 [Entamoeba invadens IP1]ELP93493.1 hypothetical protein EIN_060080 [Entamoeba invadens IP1]|eukprot:XP_004260264.1 hypothetical protein EIN_060080 [Entamoeba invadens IP1]
MSKEEAKVKDVPKERETKKSNKEVKANEAARQTKKVSKKGNQFSFIMPTKFQITIGFGLIITALVLVLVAPLFSHTNNASNNLKHSIQLFEKEAKSLEERYRLHQIKVNLGLKDKAQANEEDFDSVMKKNGIENMFFLSEMGKNVEESDVMAHYDNYGFIPDLEKIVEDSEPEDDLEDEEEEVESGVEKKEGEEKKKETVSGKNKPQSVYNTFLAHNLLKKIGKFESYKKTNNYKNTVRFVLRMLRNDTSVIMDGKDGHSDLEVMYAGTSLLVEAQDVEEYTNEVKVAIKNITHFYNKVILPDGSFDLFLRQNESNCVGTEYAMLAMQKLDMKVPKNTMRYILKCNSEDGPLSEPYGEYLDLLSGELISKLLKTIPESLQTENVEIVDYCTGGALALLGLGLSAMLVNTFPVSYIKEYLISDIVFIVCGTVAVILSQYSYAPMLFFPVVVMGYTHYSKYIMPFIKDEFFSTLSMVAPLFSLVIYILVSKFMPTVYSSLSFVPVMFLAYILGSYVAIPVSRAFFTKEKHGMNYYAAANAIGFSLLIITFFFSLSLSKISGFLLSNIRLNGYAFTFFVGFPSFSYVLSMVACGYTIPKMSMADLAKEKKRD